MKIRSMFSSNLSMRWLYHPVRDDPTSSLRRSVLDATSQELVLTMAKLEETKCACYWPLLHLHCQGGRVVLLSRADLLPRSVHVASLIHRGELGTRTSENQLIKSSYLLLKKCALQKPKRHGTVYASPHGRSADLLRAAQAARADAGTATGRQHAASIRYHGGNVGRLTNQHKASARATFSGAA